ncbi:hypothetical protein PHMEG_0008276 [Phytophthora megakarya]|uniref:Uncharacterized protein n=1 Tax=Phytophthora megakarya TaxID=4795 RepID=A0A225WJE4_9STRA|nr:hypothetical protein PHMEG_0008276 [Phytophthora megakarya]
MDDYLATLPPFSRGRNDPARCKFDHVTNANGDNLLIKHDLRRMLTVCRSERCKASEVTCKSSGVGTFAMAGEHTMEDPNVLSPKSQQLTLQMRAFIDE